MKELSKEENKKIDNYGLSDDVEYIIIQEENENDIEDTSGNVIAMLTPNGFETSDGYMIRVKFKDKEKD